MKKIHLLVTLLLASAPMFAIAAEHQVTLGNNTSWTIHELYFSPTKEQDWGPDQLSDDTIASNASFTLTGIPTGKYDVKIVDEDGDECIIEGVKLADSETVVLNDEMLLGCQGATEQAEDE